jgi:UDPglucose 6-dehydrogenase
MQKFKIGFIGQGMVGKNMADDFEDRGYEVVRYSLEPEYIANKEKIEDCDVVFIAVPTPTTPKGFDDSILRKEVKLIGKGKLAVIKSTILPGITESIQKENLDIYILHSPEFLVAASANTDVRNPERNLIGIPIDNKEYQKKAQLVLSLLPRASYERILLSKETELIKYIGNNFLFMKVVFMNLMYDLSKKMDADWSKVSEAVSNDGRIGKSHMNPIHDGGRGAGGHCFPKDFEALLQFYKQRVADKEGEKVLESIRDKNTQLLKESNKDKSILKGIYGV